MLSKVCEWIFLTAAAGLILCLVSRNLGSTTPSDDKWLLRAAISCGVIAVLAAIVFAITSRSSEHLSVDRSAGAVIADRGSIAAGRDVVIGSQSRPQTDYSDEIMRLTNFLAEGHNILNGEVDGNRFITWLRVTDATREWNRRVEVYFRQNIPTYLAQFISDGLIIERPRWKPQLKGRLERLGKIIEELQGKGLVGFTWVGQ